jgi:hypothetical protein
MLERCINCHLWKLELSRHLTFQFFL